MRLLPAGSAHAGGAVLPADGCALVHSSPVWPPAGTWSDANHNGTVYQSLDAHCPHFPLVDLLIGPECGGSPHSNYTDAAGRPDLHGLEFLRNASLLIVGDSVDRYALRFL